MKTCKNCKWWGGVYEGCCDFIDTIHNSDPLTAVHISFRVSDDTGLDIRLQTGPEFGCVHFKFKK